MDTCRLVVSLRERRKTHKKDQPCSQDRELGFRYVNFAVVVEHSIGIPAGINNIELVPESGQV